VRQQALSKYIDLEVRVPPNLPTIVVDKRRIRQALINLLINAVKFTPEGGHVVLAVDQLDRPAERVRFSVIDTGIGIAETDFDRLFQPFSQVESALNRRYEGTGLGLALVKRIVELHGGQVGVTSRVNEGSCFTIDLPCAHEPGRTSTVFSLDSPAAMTHAEYDS
jgi:signal transduction histidine kinase